MNPEMCEICGNDDCICEALSAAYADGRKSRIPYDYEPNAIGWALLAAGIVVLAGLLTFWMIGAGR